VSQGTHALEGSALAAYEAFAPFYDRYTADHGHDEWMADVDAILRGYGAPGDRLLDVACGTGKSFVPMLARGWRVTACDISPAMVERGVRSSAPAGRFASQTCATFPGGAPSTPQPASTIP